jgi:hypothetical protein
MGVAGQNGAADSAVHVLSGTAQRGPDAASKFVDIHVWVLRSNLISTLNSTLAGHLSHAKRA